MNKKIIAQNEEIVIGVDVSDAKHNCAAVRVRGGVLIRDDVVKPDIEAWKKYLDKFPGCEITVVYESGPQGYTLHDAITALGRKIEVIAPVKHIGVKTDKRDARAIARDYLSGNVKIVSVPDYKKRVRRQALRLRGQFKKDLIRVKNRMSGLKRFHGIKSLLTPWRKAENDEYLQFCLGELELTAAFYEERIAEIEAVLGRIARDEEYRPMVEKLKKIKGIGELTALEIVLEVADMEKFRTGDEFASYTGLCPGERSSGETRRQGHITRQGPGRLRGALVRCAWVVVMHDAEEKKRFEAMVKRTGRKRAIVAVARRLAVRVWWTLMKSPLEKAA